ncbi:MAG: hypothetical protein ACRCYO_18915 [Bacteroidia bacterium]
MKLPSRFASFRDRMQVFLLGLLLGLVLGGGFFLLKMDQYVKELGIYKSLTAQGKEEPEEEEKEEAKTPKQKKSKTEKAEERSAVADSTASENQVADSMPTASFDPNASDEFVVRKDELLGQRTVSLQNLDQTSLADSLLRAEAGVKEEPARSITIEFWKSPLNYKGYKMSRSKLILFGMGQEDQVSLVKLDQRLYLKSSMAVYRVENTSDFRQLERVNDETLLSRLK